MIIETIQDYSDKDTKKVYTVGEKREVNKDRAEELIKAGVAKKVEAKETKKKEAEVEKEAPAEDTTEVPNENVETSTEEAPAEENASNEESK